MKNKPFPLLLALAVGAVAAPTTAMSVAGAPAAPLAVPAPVPEAPVPGFVPQAAPPERTAQAGAYSPVPPRGRVVADHDRAHQSSRSGENLGFEQLMRSAQSRVRGEYLGVEPDISRNIYRFKFLRADGNVVWVDVDGRNGRVLAQRD